MKSAQQQHQQKVQHVQEPVHKDCPHTEHAATEQQETQAHQQKDTQDTREGDEALGELSAVEQLALLQMEEESLVLARRQLQELYYKLTIEEITLKQAKV